MHHLHQKTHSRLKQTSDYWHSEAANLLTSAEVLYNNLDKKPFCWNSYKLLIGLSFELLLKSIAIQKNMELSHTHKLDELIKSINIPLSNNDDLGILKILTEYVIWAGKYPIPKKAHELPKLSNLENQYLNKTISKIGNIKIGTYNNKLDFPYLLKLWQKINDVYIHNRFPE
ncbi:hypothetical protein HV560_02350 [Mannheimia pernigra]|uniref:HEPN domain-containing protein n=1 Tax=Mannheimia pernigra TaxID=111844 RepID=A0ABD7A6V3_9PAST|nr:hypothetical protein [Mannheimia pernigra]QLB41759.1 hypothetical protein HV560_02350 [Mannheimia pernigra]